MTTEELITKVRKLEIHARHLSKQLFSGDYQSSFKGQGMSFADVRAYQYGDDIRHIDWNVTARTNEPYIKEFQEERELVVMLLVDISGSMGTAAQGEVLRDWATEVAAVIAFTAVANRDKVGLLLFDEDKSLYVPPKKGRSHLLRILRELIHAPSASKSTDVSNALRYLSLVQRRKSLAFVLSDFISAPYERALSVASRQHEVIGLKVDHPIASYGTGPRVLRITGAESHDIKVGTRASLRAQESADRLSSHHADTKATFAKAGADLVHLPIGQSYVTRLHHFFKTRSVHR